MGLSIVIYTTPDIINKIGKQFVGYITRKKSQWRLFFLKIMVTSFYEI